MKKNISLVLCISLFFSLLCACQNTTVDEPIDLPLSEGTSPSPSLDVASDDRGIPGMKASAFLLTAENSFDVPYSKNDSDDLEYSAYTCVSSGISDGVLYDYSISLDSDNEIIGATVGLAGAGASDTELFYAADLYYYALAISILDDPDKEILVAWFEESLPNAKNGVAPITICDATFELYCTGSIYWVDISKSE